MHNRPLNINSEALLVFPGGSEDARAFRTNGIFGGTEKLRPSLLIVARYIYLCEATEIKVLAPGVIVRGIYRMRVSPDHCSRDATYTTQFVSTGVDISIH